MAFVRELTKETIHLPLGCLEGGSLGCGRALRQARPHPRPPPAHDRAPGIHYHSCGIEYYSSAIRLKFDVQYHSSFSMKPNRSCIKILKNALYGNSSRYAKLDCTRDLRLRMTERSVTSSSSALLSSLELSDTKKSEPYIRALLGTASQFCEVVVLQSTVRVPMVKRIQTSMIKWIQTSRLSIKKSVCSGPQVSASSSSSSRPTSARPGSRPSTINPRPQLSTLSPKPQTPNPRP